MFSKRSTNQVLFYTKLRLKRLRKRSVRSVIGIGGCLLLATSKSSKWEMAMKRTDAVVRASKWIRVEN